MWVRCPHCGDKTQLGGATPELTLSAKKSKAWIWAVLCAVAVAGGAVGVFVSRRAQTTTPAPSPVKAEAPKPAPVAPAPVPDLYKGLKPSAVTLEKSPKSRLVYAVGTIRNDTDKQRYGVKVTLDLLDAKGETLGTTTDYTQFIDVHKEWSFKALVAYPKATSAKITSITEE